MQTVEVGVNRGIRYGDEVLQTMSAACALLTTHMACELVAGDPRGSALDRKL